MRVGDKAITDVSLLGDCFLGPGIDNYILVVKICAIDSFYWDSTKINIVLENTSKLFYGRCQTRDLNNVENLKRVDYRRFL